MTGNVVACPSCGKDTTLRINQDSKKVNHRIEEKSLSQISEDLVNKLVSKIKSFFIIQCPSKKRDRKLFSIRHL